MGVIDEKDISRSIAILKEIAEKFHSLNLKITNDSHKPLQEKGEHYSFDIEITEKLRELQEEIMGKIPFAKEEATEEMHCTKFEEIERISTSWVNNYKEKAMGENLWPHISLRCRSVEGVNYPLKFKAERLALCHLGNLCICSEILGEVCLK